VGQTEIADEGVMNWPGAVTGFVVITDVTK
jgi:hypothetical protein